MANAPQNSRPLSVRIESSSFDGDRIEVFRVVGREVISQLFRFEVEIVVPEASPLALRELTTAEASLVFEQDGELLRVVHGMVAEATDLLTSEPDYRAYRLVLVPRMHRLTLVERQDVILNTSVPDVVSEKLSLMGLGASEVSKRLLGAYAPRELIVEYSETDFAFVSRLTEHLGISFFFVDRDGEDVVVFTDHEDGFGKVVEEGTIPFRPRGDHTGVYALEEICRAMPENFVVRDYNYRTPLVEVAGVHAAAVGLAGGVVDFGANVRTPDEAASLAAVRAQESWAMHNYYRGESAVVAFGAGLSFALEGHPRLEGDAKLLLVEVHHELTQPVTLHSDVEGAYRNTFRAVPLTPTYRPPRITPKPRIHGVTTGVVEPPLNAIVGKHADIDEDGRYTVRLNFDVTPLGERGKSSLPVRMMQPHAGTGYGVHFPLHPGVEVAIAFEGGDPDRPLIVGALPNAVTTSPVTRANSNLNRIQTASGIRMTIRD